MDSLPSSRRNLLSDDMEDVCDDDNRTPTGRISIEGQSETTSLTCTGSRLRILLASVVFIFVLTAAAIPSSFLLAKESQISSLKSQNSQIENMNKFLQKQAENFSISVNTLAKEVEEKDDKLETMKRTMSDAKDALMAFFGVHFISHGNKSVEYALLDMGKKVVEWNFADNFCTSLLSELAYPDASIHTSISDLNTACGPDKACWVGITKQTTKEWVTSKGRKVNLKGLWANGQPVDKPFYDCAYLLNGVLLSELCAGEYSPDSYLFK